MSDTTPQSIYDRILAIGTAIIALASLITVVVTLRVARQQDRLAETQNQSTRALEFATIFFSPPVINARENVESVYLKSYDRIKKNANSNEAVANLIQPNSDEGRSFDRLIALYDAISACANRRVCSVSVVESIYGSEITLTYQNWYGYVMRRRVENANYGCETEWYVRKESLGEGQVVSCLP